MSYRKSLLAASIVAGLCLSGALNAQDSNPTTDNSSTSTAQQQKDKIKQLAAVTVVGIRGSEELSLDTKRAANSHVEVVSAEDIGKLPAKNVADTLAQLPGVNISSSSASEGAFDEADRVSLRGTNPSMTQTLINGHSVGTGDWFVLSQVQTVGRSVSYSLLPSEIVSQVVVHKTSEARLVEGGSAGTVDILTRKPLDYAKPFTGSVSLGGVYSTLPGKTEPQFSGLVNWKNDDNTFGVLLEGFYEKRALQRDGQEVVGGYLPTTLDGRTVYYPNEIGNALFQQKRTRKGGSIDIEWKPADNLTLDLNGFYSKLQADNINTNYMLWTSNVLGAGGSIMPGYSLNGNVISKANLAPGTSTAYGIYDQISRPGAYSKTSYVSLSADWNVSDTLSFKGEAGTTNGTGESPHQNVLELGENVGGSGSWNMNGLGSPIDWSEGANNTTPAGMAPSFGWIFGEQDIHVKDKENWFKVDGEQDFDGTLSSLQFGIRYADHTRQSLEDIAQGPLAGWTDPANFPTSYSSYPGDFGSQLGASVPNNVWMYSPAQLAAFDAKWANRDPVTRFYWNDIYSVKEKDSAAYFQVNFEGDRWGGNIGARWVHTGETINDATTSPDPAASSSNGPITTSAFGPYYWNTIKRSYSKLLPSANIKFNLTDDLLFRFAASQTLTRPDYSAMAGSVSLDDLTHTGTGGNPLIKPLISTNFDSSLEWYFMPRGLLSASVYEMSLKDYVDFADVKRTYKDIQASTTAGHDVFATYTVEVPSNVNGNVRGVELNYIQPIGDNFGVSANYTFASAHADGNQPLEGTSKNTGNVSAFFENSKFNARVSYTYRSSFYATVSHGSQYYQQGVGNLSMSLGYTINKWASLSFDAMNLNNPTTKYYYKDPAFGSQPYAFYTNGRQYYLNLHFKF